VHNGLIADLRARQEQYKASKIVRNQETIHTFSEKIFLLKSIYRMHALPEDIYRGAILPILVRLFASLATLEFCSASLGKTFDLADNDPHQNPRLAYTSDPIDGWKKWQIKPDSHGSYEIVQCKTRILPGRQRWVAECSKGDKWIGFAPREKGYDGGYGCWPETAFTSGPNTYIQSIGHRTRLLMFITVHLEKGTIDWELYDYNDKPVDEVPSPSIWLQTRDCPPLTCLEKYQHQVPKFSATSPELYFTFNLHNPDEYVRLLDYSLTQLK
jgi:hypothetical protein